MQNTEPTGRPHRNHGLFSDHYLNVTLPQRLDWRALAGEAEGMMAEVSRVLDAYAPSQNETQTEEDLVRPVLRLLGHERTYEVQPALATPEGPKRPDYVFYRDAASRDANKDPRLMDEMRLEADASVRRLNALTATEREAQRDTLDWLRVEFGVEKPGQKLEAFAALDTDAFVEEIRKRRPKGEGRLTPASLRDLRSGYEEGAAPIREARAEAAKLEGRLSDLVNEAYGLTDEEIAMLWSTAPPRMPRF